MGRMTLVLCGTEQIVKVLVPMAFEAIGLTIPAGGGAMMVLQLSLIHICMYDSLWRYAAIVEFFRLCVASIVAVAIFIVFTLVTVSYTHLHARSDAV